MCLLLRSSWLTVEGGRHGAAGVPHRRGGRAALAGSVSVGWWRSTRNSRRLVARLPSSRVDAVVSRRQRDGSSSSAAGASGTVVGSGAPRFGCGSAVAGADPESSRCRNPLAERQRDQADERAIAVRPSRERRHCPRALLLADRKAAAPAELPAGAEIPHKAPLRLRYRICQVNGAVRRARCRTPRACPQQQSAQGRLGGVRLDASGVCCSAGCTDGSRTVALLARRGRRVDRRCPRRFPVR